ncbi:hypothetical protein Vadar_029270 [Vaccinium darrowii]|uniref:Uncharacterized protein n=1 Tax=Vaccinium darrowii TaxID=229202 RepID=A0ACB7YAX5_9ERIC|nr:hypothetical protein Vadar_029270 [Vaccinium darrowii]
MSLGNKGGDDEVSIYLHVVVGSRLCEWFVIKTGSEISKEPVDPVFDSEPNKRLFSCYTVVGSTIYSIGGLEEVPSSEFPAWSDACFPAVADVYFLDTLSPGVGWKKSAHPMNFPRHEPYAFTIKSKIYVMGGVLGCDILSPTPEVHDTEEEQGWRILGDPHKFVLVDGYNIGIDGHAVVDDGKRVIVVSCQSPHLFSYYVEGEHSLEIYAEGVLGFGKEKSAVVDGILYYLDPFKEGDMFGIELANPKKSKKVVLKSNPEYDWIPQPVRGCEDYMYPPTFLVPVGEGKLAVLWTMRRLLKLMLWAKYIFNWASCFN